MKLSEFAGYGDKMEQLMRSVEAGRIVHALLFTGPHGSGKRTMAGLFAQTMLCKGSERPCGICPACKRFLAGSHPDVHVLRPQKRSIGVEEIRDLIDRLALKPYEGGRHIAIIEPADRMTPPAQNALLKTLENPVGEVVFFLITDAPGALLPTVLSRCQAVRFSDLSVGDCARVLVRRGIPPDRAARLAGMAQGSVGRALELNADEEYNGLRENVIRSLEMLKCRADVAGAAAMIAVEKGSEDTALEIMEVWARDLMAVQSGIPPRQAEEADRLSRCRLDGRALLSGVLKLRMQFGGNVSWQSALEKLFFDMVESQENRRTVLSWQQ